MPEQPRGHAAVLADDPWDHKPQIALDHRQANARDGDIKPQGDIPPAEPAPGIKHDELVHAFCELRQEKGPGKEEKSSVFERFTQGIEGIGLAPVNLAGLVLVVQALRHHPCKAEGDAQEDEGEVEGVVDVHFL